MAQQDDISRSAEVAGWLGLPVPAIAGLRAELIDAIAARMAGSEPAGIALQRELLDHAVGRMSRGRQAEVDSRCDPLTGIANRRAWAATLAVAEAECARRGTSAAVIVIDLDNLKQVNDTRGHNAGDELLRGAADVLTAESRESDHVARVGGDEFAVLALGVDQSEARGIAERLGAGLSAVGIAASVGVAVRADTGGLVRAWEDADTAMYEAKWKRKSRRYVPSGEAVLLGVVKRADAGLPGAYVRISSPDGDFVGEVQADSHGRFALHTAPGEWVLICLAPGGGRVERRVTVRSLAEVHVEIEA